MLAFRRRNFYSVELTPPKTHTHARTHNELNKLAAEAGNHTVIELFASNNNNNMQQLTVK